MTFKLSVGDVVRLVSPIRTVFACDDWKTGLYRVTQIDDSFGADPKRNDPRRKCYRFNKIKKDGTVFGKNQSYGYNCFGFDEMIEAGKVVPATI